MGQGLEDWAVGCGMWDVELGDVGTQGQGDAGMRGCWDAGTLARGTRARVGTRGHGT